MKNIVTFSALAFFLSYSGIGLAAGGTESHLAQAAGKTSLAAEECATKAKDVLAAMGLKGVDGTKPTQKSVWASADATEYSVFCRILESDIVMFTAAGKNSARIKDLWNGFYGVQEK